MVTRLHAMITSGMVSGSSVSVKGEMGGERHDILRNEMGLCEGVNGQDEVEGYTLPFPRARAARVLEHGDFQHILS